MRLQDATAAGRAAGGGEVSVSPCVNSLFKSSFVTIPSAIPLAFNALMASRLSSAFSAKVDNADAHSSTLSSSIRGTNSGSLGFLSLGGPPILALPAAGAAFARANDAAAGPGAGRSANPVPLTTTLPAPDNSNACPAGAASDALTCPDNFITA